MRYRAIALLCLLFSLATSVGLSVAAAPSLSVPERLVYQVSWTGITAGTAVQEVSSQDGELRIVYTVRSSGWLDSFFPIDDRSESLLSRGSGTEPFGMPRLFREKMNEGKTHTLKESRFDLADLKADTKDFLKKTEKSDAISAKTFDTLSCIYYIRASDLVPGKSVFFDIYDLKRLWHAEVRVVKLERVSTKLGKFRTIVVQPTLRAEGVKPRTDYMTVWLTDDERRIPVKMNMKLKLGEFSAVLVGGSYWP